MGTKNCVIVVVATAEYWFNDSDVSSAYVKHVGSESTRQLEYALTLELAMSEDTVWSILW